MTIEEAAQEFAKEATGYIANHVLVIDLLREIEGAIKHAYIRGSRHINSWNDATKKDPESTANYIVLLRNGKNIESKICTFLNEDDDRRGFWVDADDFSEHIEQEDVLAWTEIPMGSSDFIPYEQSDIDELPF